MNPPWFFLITSKNIRNDNIIKSCSSVDSTKHQIPIIAKPRLIQTLAKTIDFREEIDGKRDYNLSPGSIDI